MLSPGIPSLHFHMFTNPEAVVTLSFWFIKEALLYRHGYLNYQSLVIYLTSSLSPLPGYEICHRHRCCKFIYAVAKGKISFFFMAKWYSVL